MSKWKEKILSQCISVSSGEGLPEWKMKPGQYVVYGGNGSAGVHDDFLFEQEQLIIGRVGAHCGNIHITKPKSWITDNALIVSFLESDNDLLFWFYLLTNLNLRDNAFQSAQPVITGGILNKIKIKIPSLPTQTHIAKILTTADTVIEKTQASIAKYKAIKQGMLQDLFTCGIDMTTNKLRPRYEDAPELYKESKLGFIPVEWEVEKLGNENFFELKTGGTPSTSINEYWNGNIRWMSSGEVNKKRIYEVDGRITELGMQNSNAIFFPIHSVTIGLAGQGKTRGTVAITFVETTSNQSVAAVVFNQLVSPFFYYHLLDFEYEKLRSVSAGAGRAGLSLNILSKYNVVMPALIEQRKIAERLEVIDKKIMTEQTYLFKQQQMKTGLMNDLLSEKKLVKVEEELVTLNEH